MREIQRKFLNAGIKKNLAFWMQVSGEAAVEGSEIVENIWESAMGVLAEDEIEVTKVRFVVDERLRKEGDERLNIARITEIVLGTSEKGDRQGRGPVGEVVLRRESLSVVLHVSRGAIVELTKATITNALRPMRHILDRGRIGFIAEPVGKFGAIQARERARQSHQYKLTDIREEPTSTRKNFMDGSWDPKLLETE